MKSTGYQLRRTLAAPAIFILLLSGCAAQLNLIQQNDVPASVYRNSLSSIFSDVQSAHNIKQSLFKPAFVEYMAYLTRNGNTLTKYALQDSIKRWNAVATDKSELVRYNSIHFIRVASLHWRGQTRCSSTDQCNITLDDINILRTWLHWQLEYKVVTPHYRFNRSQLLLLNPDRDPRLHHSLEKLISRHAGATLVQYALDSGVAIKLEPLSGSHGHYNYSENIITLDPSVVNYEFNLRYLVHELLHACNTAEDNSITEEVLAELIGLDIQNQITGIEFEINPYLVFVEHILHPEYGKLVFTNDIYGELALAGIKL